MNGLWAQANTLSDIDVEFSNEAFPRLARSSRAADLYLVSAIANRNAKTIFDQFEMGVEVPAKQCNMLRVLRFKRERGGYYVLPTVGLGRYRVNVQGLFGRSCNVWLSEDTELATHVNSQARREASLAARRQYRLSRTRRLNRGQGW